MSYMSLNDEDENYCILLCDFQMILFDSEEAVIEASSFLKNKMKKLERN